MSRGAAIVTLLLIVAGCRPKLGERCNPLQFNVDGQCGGGLTCAYPPRCGVAFCCPPADGFTTNVPMCSFAPDCTGGANCCNPPFTNSEDNPSVNCQPCPAADGGM